MFLAAVLLALLASARAQNQCQTGFAGDNSGEAVLLRDQIVPAGVHNAVITIPDNACASAQRRQHAGTAVTVCDWDAAPRVVMADLRHAHVTRTGAAAQPAVVHSVAYCV